MMRKASWTVDSEKMTFTLFWMFLIYPTGVIANQVTTCSDIEALCILLKRLVFPCRYSDMTPMFGRNMTEMCLIYNNAASLLAP